MADRVDVSVIIVNWNTRDLLLDVINSVKATTHSVRVEIIVVDNASVDGSVAAVRQSFPDVTVIVNPDNYGFARANNIGLRAAHGEAFCLVNTDIVALEGVIDELWTYLRTHPRVGAVGPRTLDRDGNIRRNVRRFPSLRNALGDHLWLRHVIPGVFPGRSLPLPTFEFTHTADVLSGCFLMVRRDAVSDVGPLDESFFFYGEDTDWGLRFRQAGWECIYDARARTVHLGGASTAAHPLTYHLEMEKADLRYWRKHHGRGAVASYIAIRLVHNVVSVIAWSLIWLSSPGQRERCTLKLKGGATNAAWLLGRRSGTAIRWAGEAP